MAFRKSNYNEWNHHLSWEKETITIDQGLLDSCHLHDLLPFILLIIEQIIFRLNSYFMK